MISREKKNEKEPGEGFWARVKGLPSLVLVGIVRFYRKCISPLFPPTCRYTPSCSEYAIIAIQRYGALKGFWLAAKRILRCHPWHDGGYDPVP